MALAYAEAMDTPCYGVKFAGQWVRAGLGYATILPDMDFETYSEAGYAWNPTLRKWQSLPGIAQQRRGLKVVGSRAYIEHPSFRVLSLAYDLKDGNGPQLYTPNGQYPRSLFNHILAGGLIEAWFAGFEWQVWNLYCTSVLRWPALPITQMRCAMAKARAFALPSSLAETGHVLKLATQKDPEGIRLLNKFSIPRNPTKKDPRLFILPSDDPVDGPKLYQYNITDVSAESLASEHTPDLSDMELQFWFVDQHINIRGVRIDLRAIEDCISIVEQAFTRYNAELCALTQGAVDSGSKLPALVAWCRAQGYYIEGAAEEVVEEVLARTDVPPQVRRALEIRQLIGSASVKKLFSMRAQASLAERLHNLYQFFKARTARWAGEGPQPQNLYKGAWKNITDVETALKIIAYRSLELVEYYYGDALEAVNNCLRSLFISAPGYDLICSDYVSIESVVAAALAGEDWVLEVFRTHGKIYEAMASRISGVPLQEILDYKKEHGIHHPLRNKLGKYGTLASGFGGWIGAWKQFGADEYMTDDEIKAGILAYRDANPAIVEMWGGQSRDTFKWGKIPYKEYFGLEGAIVKAIENPGEAFSARSIVYQVVDDVLYCQVPSGGLITYHKPRLEPSRREYAQLWEQSISYEGENQNPKMGPIGWIRMSIYGGKAFENVVQRVARDILAHGLVNLERAGYRPVMHSHDEPVGEVPEGFGSIEGFEACMNDLPAWAKNWPVFARGGWRGKRYGKFD